MKFRGFYCVKVWDESSGRIRRFLSRKVMVVVGSDRHADIRLPKLQGFDLRLDFNECRIVTMKTGEEIIFPEKKIVSYGAYAFVWTRPRLNRPLKIASLVLLGLGLTGFALRSALQPTRICQLASSEDLKSFRHSLKIGDLIKARAELSILIRLYEVTSEQTNCDFVSVIESLRLDYEKTKFLRMLSDQSILTSIQQIRNLSTLPPDQLAFLERKILKKLRDRYFEAYRLEDDDDSLALEIMTEVHEACRQLNKSADCFRNTELGLRE